MKNDTYFRINQDGIMLQVTETVSQIDVSQQFLTQISQGVPRRAASVFPLSAKNLGVKDGNVGISVMNGGIVVFSIALESIFIECGYHTAGKLIWPSFKNTDPQIRQRWKVPGSMGLVLMVTVNAAAQASVSHLVACDNQNRTWQLPLGNTYEDCKLCEGDYDRCGASMLGAAMKSVEQFQGSKWNMDLLRASDTDAGGRCSQLFGFTVEDDCTKQIFDDGDWQKHCRKVSVDYITKNIVNPLTGQL
jgi:hypothetical protein